nr:hypothetical protein [Desulfobacula sp.]
MKPARRIQVVGFQECDDEINNTAAADLFDPAVTNGVKGKGASLAVDPINSTICATHARGQPHTFKGRAGSG